MVPRYARPAMTAIWEPEARYPHLVRDRGACDRRAGRAGRGAAGARRKALWDWWATEPGDRRRRDRRDRGGDQARRHRLPDLGRRAGRARGALHAPGHDQLRRARHLPRGAARAGRRHPARRSRRAARGAEAPRLRAQADPDDRPQPRHPCRAGHLRAQAGPGLCRVRRATAPGWSRRATRSPPARSRARSAPSPISTRGSRRMSPTSSGLAVEPVSTQVIPRDRHAMFFATLGVIACVDRAAGDRDPPPAAHRGARGRGIFLARPEGLARRCRTSATRC